MLTGMLLSAALIASQSVEKQTLPGATNVTRPDVAIMCAGATSNEAFPEIRKLGFTSIINLRRDGEGGMSVSTARDEAAANGLKYVHIPVDPSNPSGESVDAFLAAVSDKANGPIYVHCGSANRVAALWLIKRVVVDGWSVERATTEAEDIGLTSPALRKFALDYVAGRKR